MIDSWAQVILFELSQSATVSMSPTETDAKQCVYTASRQKKGQQLLKEYIK